MDEQNRILTAALRDAAVTREVVMAAGALAELPAVARRRVAGARLLVVADHTTYGVAGAAVIRHLAAAGLSCEDPLILSAAPRLKPRTEAAERIAARLRESDSAAVAVGSGVVNDLVKYASALAGRPYVCVATAASMDGYAASGAALMDGSFKHTMDCAPPVAVLADLDVLAAAPTRMASWGYGDLAGKVVAGADWVLADALGVEAINPRPYAMVQDHLHSWLDEPRLLGERDPEAFARLLSGLLVTGFAMQAHGNSRPASGSDHQFSHLWEMESVSIDGEPAAHGACVGVGCVAMLALYDWLLMQAISPADIAQAQATPFDDDALEREIASSFPDSAVAENARSEMRAKRAAGDRADRLRRLAQQWPQLRGRLLRTLTPAADMQRRLRAVGGAAHPAELGVSLQKLAADHRRARLIRRRYTVLDLVDDLGWLDRAVHALFAAEGFWGRQPAVQIPAGRDPAERAVH
ncbi:MAG: sn-glycerol-1-phosphate dehydrogenase [Betaproteobacteria bacterium]